MNQANQERKSPWFWVSIGCLGVLCVIAAAIAGLTFFGYRFVQGIKAEMKDPAQRTAKATAMLGCSQLPEGYNAMASLSVPLLMDVVVLTDKQPGSDGTIHDLGQRSFVFFRFIRGKEPDQKMLDYFEGRTDDSSVLRDHKINLDVDEILKRGVVEAGGARVLYVAQRGSIRTQGGLSPGGIMSLGLVQCPADKQMRMTVWSGPLPPGTAAPATATKEGGATAGTADAKPALNLEGTPADEKQLSAFLGQFKLCGS